MNSSLNGHAGHPKCPVGGFTLVELLACLAVITVLAALIGSQVGKTFDRTKSLECLSLMRKIGSGIQQYSMDNNNEFPRSLHNAWSLGKTQWSAAILPYIDTEGGENPTELTFTQKFRCPVDKRKGDLVRSYALNVFFQLGPGDSYKGSPSRWGTFMSVPRPAATVLVAENLSSADHFMSHMWTTAKGAANAIDSRRHGKTSNYLFVDGHVESLPLEAVFDPKQNINKWNPCLAN